MDGQIKKIDPDSFVLWPDGTITHYCNLHEYTYMSDDYEIVYAGTDRWHELESQEE